MKNNFTIIDAKTLLSKEDYSYFKIWKKNDFNVTKLSKHLKITYYSAHCRIHRVKKNLRAAKLLNDGYLVSKEILNYNVNKNINYFIKRLSVALQDNALNNLRFYFPNELISKISEPNIKKVIDYDVRLEQNQIHKIFIHHITFDNQFTCCAVKLKINKRNRIRVVDLILSPKKTIILNSPKKKILDKLPRENKEGIIPNNFNELEKIIKKNKL